MLQAGQAQMTTPRQIDQNSYNTNRNIIHKSREEEYNFSDAVESLAESEAYHLEMLGDNEM